MTLSRPLKITLWILTGILVAIALLVVAILTFDWNRARPWLNEKVSEATGRPFAILGDLSVNWQRGDAEERGWRRLVPWPQLVANNIELANVDWSKTAPMMAKVEQVRFSLNPLPLLEHRIVVPTLQFTEPNVLLERTVDGRVNWTFPSDKPPSKWKLDLQQLVWTKGTLRFVDDVRKVDVTALTDTISDAGSPYAGSPYAGSPYAGSPYGFGWKMSGKFNGEPVSGIGRAGSALSLQRQLAPYPVEADVRIGKTRIAVKGTLTKPSDLAALDLRLQLSGANLAHLYPITGIVLPDSPRYTTEGRLIGELVGRGDTWTYEKFSGKVGSSDIAGSLVWQDREPRPRLKGTLVSNLLHFDDLAPLIGSDSEKSKLARSQAGDKQRRQPGSKVLPVAEFRTERWTSIDADVKLTGHKIVRDATLPIDHLSATVQLKDGVVSLTPLNFGVAGGNVTSTIRLDGSNPKIKAQITMTARHLKLKQLFPTFDPMQASLGEVNADAKLSATGDSIAGMLATSNGEVKGLINQGTVSKIFLEQIGLNVGSLVLAQLFGDRQVQLNCMAADFAVTDGRMQSRVFVVDTDEAVINVEGSINLATEKLDLTIRPKSKGVRLITLRSPLYVAGDFKKPDIGIDKGVLALKAGGALLLGAAAPLAALLPLINVGPDADSGCQALLAEARKKPQAPAPGKRATKR